MSIRGQFISSSDYIIKRGGHIISKYASFSASKIHYVKDFCAVAKWY